MPPKKKTLTKSDTEVDVRPENIHTAVTANDVSELDEAHSSPHSSLAAVFAQLQQAVEGDATNINNHLSALLELVEAAENPQNSIFLRVRFLELIGKHLVHIRENNALKKIVTSLVKIIGGDDNTPQLLVAALQCFGGLGPVSMLEKQWEYLSREGADILLQVIIDNNAFPEPVRQAARKSLDELTQSAFRPVVTKLMHWLSDDREDDEENQLLKERHMALAVLNRLSRTSSLRSHWTEEVQELVFSFIQRILDVVNVREFTQLVRIAVHLPIIVAKGGGIFLLKSYLSNHKLDNDRQLEAVTILAGFVQVRDSTDEFDLTPALESGGIFSQEIDGESWHGYLVARLMLLAARLADFQGAEKIFPKILASLMHLFGPDAASLPENLSTLEAMLFAVVAIARKKPRELLQKAHEESFNTAMNTLVNATTSLEAQLLFSVKKLVMRKEAHGSHAEMLSCLHNIRVIAGSLSSKHLPLTDIKESWSERQNLPVLKQSGEMGRVATALPPPPGNALAKPFVRNQRNDAQKRQRGQSRPNASRGSRVRLKR